MSIASLIKTAAEMKRKTTMVESHSNHCPHCDFEFREKCYPVVKDKGARVSSIDKVYQTGEYDEHCPECDGILDQKERSDEEIDGDNWLAFPGSKEQAKARRDAQRRRRAERAEYKCEHGVNVPFNTCDYGCKKPMEKKAVVKQEGDEWILYTADGERVLGRHPSAKKAYAQEYAIKKSQESKLEKGASIASLLMQARNATHEHPTEAQRQAGNYAKGTFSFKGLTIKIENPKDSIRRGIDNKGKKWESRLPADYGYFKGTEAIDGDAVDVFIGPDLESDMVVAIDQVIDGKYDETKFVVAVKSQAQAEKLYLSAYQKGWKLGDVSTTTVQQLKEWLKDGDHKKPFKGQLVKAAAWWHPRKPRATAAPEDRASLKFLPSNLKSLLSVTFGEKWATKEETRQKRK